MPSDAEMTDARNAVAKKYAEKRPAEHDMGSTMLRPLQGELTELGAALPVKPPDPEEANLPSPAQVDKLRTEDMGKVRGFNANANTINKTLDKVDENGGVKEPGAQGGLKSPMEKKEMLTTAAADFADGKISKEDFIAMLE